MKIGDLVGSRKTSNNIRDAPELSTSTSRNQPQALTETLAEFKEYFNSSLGEEYPDTYKGEDRLRVSGFPYCGLRHLYRRLAAQDNVKVNFGSKYYTGVGTVTHEALQSWMGYKGRIFGAWKCTTPRCRGARSFSNNSNCPKCGAVMAYEELTVKYKSHVSGHLDGVYRDRKGRYFVIDYKTSSIRVILSNRKTNMLPYKGNVAQIKAYCALVEDQFDIKISGWILVYIARDSPQRFNLPVGGYITEAEKKSILKEITTYDRHYPLVMNMERLSEALVLIQEKPCKCKQDYIDKFKSYDDCPLSVGNVCFNEVELRKKLRLAWAEKPINWKERKRPKYLLRKK